MIRKQGRTSGTNWKSDHRSSRQREANGTGRVGDNTSRRLQWLISAVCDRLPTSQLFCDQLRALLIVASVHDAHVFGIGAQVDTGGPLVDVRVSVRTSCPVPGRAIGGLDSDLSRPIV